MAYKKSYRRPRRSRRSTRQPWFKNANSAYKLAVQAAKDIWYIKGLVNSEMFHTNLTGSTTITATGGVLHLTALAQGDTSSGRTGNSVLFRNLLQRFRITLSPSAATTYVRFMLVQDNQQIGDTSPTISDVLESVDVLSPLATATQGRFKVLQSKVISLDNVKTKTHLTQKYKDMRHHVRFNGPSNTDIQKGGIYFMYVSDQAVGTSPTLDYNFKLGYRDN